MYTYKFEKGSVKSGAKMIHTEEDEEFYKKEFGELLCTEEEQCVEPVYALKNIHKDESDENLDLILTRNVSEIIRLEESGDYELACVQYITNVCDMKKIDIPISFYCLEGLAYLVEEYIDGTVISEYICVSL